MSGRAPWVTSAAVQRAGAVRRHRGGNRRAALAGAEHDPGGLRVLRAGTPHTRGPRRRRPRPRPLWAASIAAAAALAAGTVWWQTADDRELASSYRHTLAVAHGHDLSAAPLLLAGAPDGDRLRLSGFAFLDLRHVQVDTPQGRYDVRLLTRDGRRLALRSFTARPGGTAWGSTIQVPIRQIQKLEFIRSNVPTMTASFG